MVIIFILSRCWFTNVRNQQIDSTLLRLQWPGPQVQQTEIFLKNTVSKFIFRALVFDEKKNTTYVSSCFLSTDCFWTNLDQLKHMKSNLLMCAAFRSGTLSLFMTKLGWIQNNFVEFKNPLFWFDKILSLDLIKKFEFEKGSPSQILKLANTTCWVGQARATGARDWSQGVYSLPAQHTHTWWIAFTIKFQ